MSKELLSMIKPLKKVVNEDFYVLTNDERPTEPRTYRNYYNGLMAKLDIPKLKYHGLRHSFATRVLKPDVTIKLSAYCWGIQTFQLRSTFTSIPIWNKRSGALPKCSNHWESKSV